MLNREYMANFLKEILAIGSTAGDTYDAVDYCKKELESYGIETEYTKKGAVIGYCYKIYEGK